jgi:hypothetical protein
MREGALFYTSGDNQQNKYGGLLKISENGTATTLMYWEDADTGYDFSGFDNERKNRDRTLLSLSPISNNGNFYRLAIEDSDGNAETKDDYVMELISFIRN